MSCERYHLPAHFLVLGFEANWAYLQENILDQRKTKVELLAQIAQQQAEIAELKQALAIHKANFLPQTNQQDPAFSSDATTAVGPIKEERAELAQIPIHSDWHQTEVELSRIFEQLPALINVFRGPEHVFVLANPPMRQVLGNRDLIGKTVRQAQPELAGQGIYELLDEVYQTGKPFYGNEIPVEIDRHNNGMLAQSYFNFSYLPLYNAVGEIEGIISFAYEVTDLVKARHKIEESAKHLAGLNEQKDEFLSVAAHELRSPLTAIKGFTQLLQRHLVGQLDGDKRAKQPTALDQHLHFTQSILGQVGRMSELINRLLELSVIEDKRLILNYTPRPNLVKLVQEVIEQQRITTEKHHIVGQLPEQVLAVPYDEARIVEVLFNLLNNAVKYSPAGTTITVGLETQSVPPNQEIIVWVQDQGYGIETYEQQRLFEKFYRASQLFTEKKQGLGLGFYISVVRLSSCTADVCGLPVSQVRVASSIFPYPTVTILPAAKWRGFLCCLPHRNLSVSL